MSMEGRDLDLDPGGENNHQIFVCEPQSVLKVSRSLANLVIINHVAVSLNFISSKHPSMWSTEREIAAGDVVIIWLTRDAIQPLLITPGKDLNSKYGFYRHSDLVGIPYGSKVGSRNGKGFIHVLRPTPELWTMALPHRTQILYLADIAFIISWLNIRPASRVIEAGTGSGSFSHSVARTIGSSGHLWSYEFHEARANKAKLEFVQHGMGDIVTLTHCNVCKDGFAITDIADAVFLDLPAPWDAIEHAKRALRKDCTTRICCFSPCMEQVLRTTSVLNEAGFTEIAMYETIIRPHEVNQIPTLQNVSDVSARLRKAEQMREEKRLKQIAGAKARSAEGHRGKRNREDETSEIPVDVDDGLRNKRVKTEQESEQEDGAQMKHPELPGIPPHFLSSDLSTSYTAGHDQPNTTKFNVSKVMSEVRGHTSYLTFACLHPSLETLETSTLLLCIDDQSIHSAS